MPDARPESQQTTSVQNDCRCVYVLVPPEPFLPQNVISHKNLCLVTGNQLSCIHRPPSPVTMAYFVMFRNRDVPNQTPQLGTLACGREKIPVYIKSSSLCVKNELELDIFTSVHQACIALHQVRTNIMSVQSTCTR